MLQIIYVIMRKQLPYSRVAQAWAAIPRPNRRRLPRSLLGRFASWLPVAVGGNAELILISDHDLVAAGFFGTIQRQICLVLYDDCIDERRRTSNTGAECGRKLLAACGKPDLGKSLAQFVHYLGRGRCIGVGQYHDEFLAAVAANQIGLAQALAQQPR